MDQNNQGVDVFQVSLVQAVFSIFLALLHYLLCAMASSLWVIVAIPASLWFYLVLPILFAVIFVRFIVQSIKNKSINQQSLIYLCFSALGFALFILTDCYLSV